MKILLILVLFTIITSIIITPAFAESKIESFVNLATKARDQVKIQMDKMPSISQETKDLYSQGNAETELLISAAKAGDNTEAKKHFLAAMKAFREITQVFSETIPSSTNPSQNTVNITTPINDFEYGNTLKRFEANVNILKSVASKNNLQVDFSKIDGLIQSARSSLASGDVVAVEKTISEIKTSGNELQSTIKNMVSERSNTRAISFVNKYIAKIDAVLAQAKELNIPDDQINKLKIAKEELESSNDPSQIVIKIKRVYQINLDLLDAKNQKILSELSKLENRLSILEPKIDDTIKPKFDEAKSILISLKASTSIDDPIKTLRILDSKLKSIESYVSSQSNPPNTQNDQKIQEKQKVKVQTKAQKYSTEISKLESRLAEIEPHIDDVIKPKFDTAKSMLAKLKESGTESKMTIRSINLLIDEIVQYVESVDSEDTE